MKSRGHPKICIIGSERNCSSRPIDKSGANSPFSFRMHAVSVCWTGFRSDAWGSESVCAATVAVAVAVSSGAVGVSVTPGVVGVSAGAVAVSVAVGASVAVAVGASVAVAVAVMDLMCFHDAKFFMACVVGVNLGHCTLCKNPSDSSFFTVLEFWDTPFCDLTCTSSWHLRWFVYSC